MYHEKRDRLWWDKHGSCVPLDVCVQEQEGEQSRECERRCTSAGPRAFCSMYSAHSSQSSFLQSQGCVPTRRASQQHGASTWPCQLPGPVAWVNKVSYKTNTGVTLATRIRICEFMQGNSEGTGICALMQLTLLHERLYWLCASRVWRDIRMIGFMYGKWKSVYKTHLNPLCPLTWGIQIPWCCSVRVRVDLTQGGKMMNVTAMWQHQVHALCKDMLHGAGFTYYAHNGVLNHDFFHCWCQTYTACMWELMSVCTRCRCTNDFSKDS